mgnify:CR=1 FL=1
MIAVLVWRRESDVAAGCVIVRQKLKSYSYPGYRRLIQGNRDEDAARRKCQLPGTGYGAVIVVEIDGNAVLTLGFKIGQGAFLTASANGVDTSPVVRGIYVLEKILGYTPPPPPPDVAVLEPDIRGATSVREQLIKHREIATCAECHRKIDPLGFALENFDAIGGWRDRYDDKLKVDPSGKLPDGNVFSTNAEFRDLILEKEETFSRCLAEKLLTYAIGRQLNGSDRPSIDGISMEMAGAEKGLRDLIQAVVGSESFLQN